MTTSETGHVRFVPAADWRRRLHGPFRILIASTITEQSVISEPTPHISAGVLAMIDTPVFPEPDRRMVLFDADGWVALGYCTEATHLKAYGVPLWWGCDLGFAALEASGLIEPIDLAIMESLAQENAPGAA